MSDAASISALASACRCSASSVVTYDVRRPDGASWPMISVSSRTSTRQRWHWPTRLAVKSASDVSSSASATCRGDAKGLKRRRSSSARPESSSATSWSNSTLASRPESRARLNAARRSASAAELSPALIGRPVASATRARERRVARRVALLELRGLRRERLRVREVRARAARRADARADRRR